MFHELLHHFLHDYFALVDQVGIPAVIIAVACLIPSEIVIPPAAYTEIYSVSTHPGTTVIRSLWLTLAGGLGYTLGSVLIYGISRLIGRPLVLRYGKYILITEKKVTAAERWLDRYGPAGIFFATLIPGLRHVICVPAGIANMHFRHFTLSILAASSLWSAILVGFAFALGKQMQAVMHGETGSLEYQAAIRTLSLATGLLVAVLVTAYILILKRSPKTPEPQAEVPEVE